MAAHAASTRTHVRGTLAVHDVYSSLHVAYRISHNSTPSQPTQLVSDLFTRRCLSRIKTRICLTMHRLVDFAHNFIKRIISTKRICQYYNIN